MKLYPVTLSALSNPAPNETLQGLIPTIERVNKEEHLREHLLHLLVIMPFVASIHVRVFIKDMHFLHSIPGAYICHTT